MQRLIKMKVKELIENLKECNPNADVGIKTIDDLYIDQLYISYICEDKNGKEVKINETKQIWIECVDFCAKCQFNDKDFCLAYDKNCGDIDECFQFIEEE